jgi:hypothetical protein
LGDPNVERTGTTDGEQLAQSTDRAMAHVVGPCDIRKYLSCLTASDRFSSLVAGQFGLATKDDPLAFARCLPSPVRVRINSRSNSANPPNTVSINRPCGVVVSAQVSLSVCPKSS